MPDTAVWEKWVAEAARQAAGEPVFHDGRIILPRWDYKEKLKDLFTEERKEKKKRPKWPTLEQINTLIPQAVNAAPKEKPQASFRSIADQLMQQRSESTRNGRLADGGDLTNSPIDEADEGDPR